MSVSIYYTARRSQPITPQEQHICHEIAKRYDEQYPFGELYEGFCIYDLKNDISQDGEDVILDGATKIPSGDDPMLLEEITDWWLKCLQEITGVLSGAQWNVNLDDIELEWSEEKQTFLL